MKDIDKCRVEPGSKVDLASISTDDHGGMSKDKAAQQLERHVKHLCELQEVMYAEGKHSLLVVLQAMDAAGKDSTISAVFGPLNPQGCNAVSFKVPNDLERRHDFLWRIHQRVPARGYMTVFNRSHYEDVLIVRVKELAPHHVWHKRFDHINDFEKMLHEEGTTIVKFYLHISKDYQKERLERRLELPEKHWKFNPEDLAERQRWDKYMEAYQDALSRCSTDYAPWYIIPAETRWYRNLLVARILVRTLGALDMHYPRETFDPEKIVIP
jgi:PPK2 family polyphosphate:nucleotide phosphotransferase